MHAELIWTKSLKNDGITGFTAIIAVIKQRVKSITNDKAKKSTKVDIRWADGHTHQASKA